MAAPSLPRARTAGPSRSVPPRLVSGLLVGLLIGPATVGTPGITSPVAHALPAAAEPTDDAPQPAENTRIRIASFNVLGHGHTASGGDRRGWASGPQRMTWAVRLIRRHDLDVVGMQELQEPQWSRLRELAADEFAMFPGNRLGSTAMHNSIVFRRDTWRRLDARTVRIPYFKGNLLRMPYVWLEHRKTGRRIWVINTHNPANARGPAQKWRDKGFRIEADLINQLRRDYPNSAVFSTGDKNNRSEYFCPLYRRTSQHAANGGSIDGGCTLPRPSNVDWVSGSSDTWFTDFQALRSALVRKTTDHPLVMATAHLAPAKPMPLLERVVVVGVQGLTRRSLVRLGADGTPQLTAMRADGVSTLEARTEREATDARSNLLGVLTGRRVSQRKSGHGVRPGATPATVSAAAGRYVSSLFDITHNFSLSTEMITSDPASAIVDRTWSAAGGRDPYGRDDGRDKIDRFRRLANDTATLADLRTRLADGPANLTVVELTGPARTGRKHGFNSPEYLAAVTRTDTAIGQIRSQLAQDESLTASTVLVVVGLHGGRGNGSHDTASAPANYRVPLLVTGNGVPAGEDLYALNPTLADPGPDRPGYQGTPPAWVMSVTAVVQQALGVPQLPGAAIAYQAPTTVFGTFR